MDDFMDLIISFAAKYPDKNFVIKEHPSFKQSIVGKYPQEKIYFLPMAIAQRI